MKTPILGQVSPGSGPQISQTVQRAVQTLSSDVPARPPMPQNTLQMLLGKLFGLSHVRVPQMPVAPPTAPPMAPMAAPAPFQPLPRATIGGPR